MRLLKLSEDGGFRPIWFSDGREPPYAILSHTWSTTEDDEVKLQDIIDGSGTNKPGFKKLVFCNEQAKHDDLQYFWVDTCCIDQKNHVELSEAINSMFRWYQKATKCYVYLSDVSVCTQDGKFHMEWQSAFRNSRWFTRGWTLQELLAPKIVEFYSRDGIRLGDKRSFEHQIAKITRIPTEALRGEKLSQFSIEKRFSWVESRQTTKEEDKAYCLLGIFGIFLPLIYGEGESSAMRRLEKEIRESRNNELQSISKIL
jgi:heterokaryon incompatibility protein (HET)